MEYTIIRSGRKTIALSVNENLEIQVKANYRTSKKTIDAFVNKNKGWIEKQILRIKSINENKIVLSKEQISDLKKQAKEQLTALTEKYADIMDVRPTGVKITSAGKRWGSCSYKNSICYSYKVMLLPLRCREYVVIHELAHIKEKNHSQKFYKIIEKYMPDYKQVIKEIKNVYIE